MSQFENVVIKAKVEGTWDEMGLAELIKILQKPDPDAP